MNSDALPKTAFPVDKYFQPIVHWTIAPCLAEAEAIERRARIEVHPFFEYAKNHPDALALFGEPGGYCHQPVFVDPAPSDCQDCECSRSLTPDAGRRWRAQLRRDRRSFSPVAHLKVVRVH